jgi:hypothetical protein
MVDDLSKLPLTMPPGHTEGRALTQPGRRRPGVPAEVRQRGCDRHGAHPGNGWLRLEDSAPGSQARNSIGIVLVTGMTVGTIFTLFEHQAQPAVEVEPEGELAIAK